MLASTKDTTMSSTGVQLSVAVAEPVPAGEESSSQLTVISTGQIITGGVLSITVIT